MNALEPNSLFLDSLYVYVCDLIIFMNVLNTKAHKPLNSLVLKMMTYFVEKVISRNCDIFIES